MKYALKKIPVTTLGLTLLLFLCQGYSSTVMANSAAETYSTPCAKMIVNTNDPPSIPNSEIYPKKQLAQYYDDNEDDSDTNSAPISSCKLSPNREHTCAVRSKPH